MEAHIGPAAVAAAPRAGASPWLVSPAFDLCFLANLWWPLVLLGGWLLHETDTWFGFWQVYFLTTPHRWLTLVLVVADPDRRARRTGLLALIAVAAAALVGGVWMSTGQLLCLALLDYLWNAWHFGAQHGGIARMYARRSGVAASPGQTWSLRLLVVYAALRLAGWSTGWIEESAAGAWSLASADMVVLALCVWGVGRRWFGQGGRPADLGWRCYVGSTVLAYALLLAAVNARGTTIVSALVAATAGMHAVEYLAVVTHYARRRQQSGTRGLFMAVAQRWSWLLIAYLVLLGSLAFFSDQRWREAWLAVNLLVAFLHYAYDGLIWKLRESHTSAALGVELSATTGAAP